MNQKKTGRRLLVTSLCILLIMTMISACTSPANKPEATKPAASVAPEASQPAASGNFKAGTYKASAEGLEGAIELEVTFAEDQTITDIKVLKQNETAGIGVEAIDVMKDQIIAGQSLAVDAVSGASRSSEAVLAAVEDAIVQAGGNVEEFKSRTVAKAGEGKVEQLAADVVVVGAGASGVSAAVSAADKGAKVIIIEKTNTIGGASNLSWAGKFYNSSAAIEKGVQVDIEKEIADWIVNNHWRVDAAAIRQYVVQSSETYDWLADKGYQTSFLNFAGEQLHVLPAYETRQDLLKTMLAQSVEAGGGQVLTETTAQKLMTGANGEVTGVVAVKADGSKLEISAKSVVMATGGYSGNKEMVKEAFGFEGLNGGLGQNIGEGLKMSWEVGAKVPDNFGGQMLHQTIVKATDNLKKNYSDFEASYPMMLAYLPTVLNVGPSGARFRDETATLSAVAAANTSAFNGAYHMVIVSQAQLDKLEKEGMNGIKAPKLPGMPPKTYASFKDEFTLENPWKNVNQVLDAMVAAGDGFKGQTVEELAKNAGMDQELLANTVKQYVDATKTGVDDAFGKAKEYLVPMGESGPYYAIKAEINNLGSVGGLLVNTNFQVLDNSRLPVKGLYAVGLESEGVLFNDTYVGNGIGIGYSFTSGRLGGEFAADTALVK